MKASGYWIPAEGSAKTKRTIVYFLEHPSRYEAYRNWNNFSNDKEWEKVMDQPEFQGLLSEKPTGFFSLQTIIPSWQATKSQNRVVSSSLHIRPNPGKLSALNNRFREHTTRLFNKHGIKSLGYWTPFDQPDREDTLIYLIHHANRKQADLNWKAFGQDPEWKKIVRESRVEGKLLVRPPERLYLKALDFSPLR